ncbi:MAG: acyl-[acyl-carrier-protein]--UDP-N-acetylglucosamine O-acyltransferase [Chitinophagales bacterium]|nr:MAG: acyl-[acyl-carrier-protein]--UDP-N-acetylglucosamine O-acyltransferase [Chitinophagales bacterium]
MIHGINEGPYPYYKTTNALNHSLSHIHPEARIANNVVIEPFVTIGKNVEIGEGTWIGPYVTIMEGVRIGKNCRVFPGAVIGAIPQDLKFNGEETTVEIGDNVTIREYVTVHRGTKQSNRTVIMDNVLLMAYVHVAHDCVIGRNAILSNGVNLAGHIEVGNFAIVGGMSGIHQFIKIGQHAFIAGGSLVGKDVPPYVKAARYPLSYAGVNSIGLRRRGFTSEKINHILDIYRILFVKQRNVSIALNIIESEMPASDERDEIIRFIRASERGIIKGYNPHHDNNS